MIVEVADSRRKSFFMVDNLVIDQMELSIYTKMAYIVLIRHADKDGISWPSMERIAKEGGMSRRQAIRSITELAALNMIRTEKASGISNRYNLLDKSLWKGQPVPDSHQSQDREPVTEGHQSTSDSEAPVDGAAGDPQAPVPVPGRHPKNTHRKRPINPPLVSPPGGFLRFWEAYPDKIAKQQALKAWLNLDPDEALEKKILSGIETHKATDLWRRDVGIPYPATFLNQRRWEDEICKAQPKDKAREDSPKPRVFWTMTEDRYYLHMNGQRTEVEESAVPPAVRNSLKSDGAESLAEKVGFPKSHASRS